VPPFPPPRVSTITMEATRRKTVDGIPPLAAVVKEANNNNNNNLQHPNPYCITIRVTTTPMEHLHPIYYYSPRNPCHRAHHPACLLLEVWRAIRVVRQAPSPRVVAVTKRYSTKPSPPPPLTATNSCQRTHTITIRAMAAATGPEVPIRRARRH